MTIRSLICIVSVAFAIGSAGCGSARRESSAPIGDLRVSAVARSPQVNASAPSSAPAEPFEPFLLPSQFVAEGKGEFPLNSTSRVQRLAIAEAEARRNALRSLAEQILNFRPKGDKTVRDLTRGIPQWEQRLTEALETESQVDYMSSDKLVIARVGVPGSAVQQSLSLNPESFPQGRTAAPEGGSVDPQIKQEEARELAIEAARSLLYSEVMKVQTARGSVEYLVSRDESLGRRIEAMIAELEPEDVSFRSNGACEATLVLPRERLEAELSK